jgi:hypothetical protein
VFAGADDLNFQPGWDTAALALMDGWVQVVGTNDLLNPYVTAGLHATHYLVDRRYLDDVGGVVDQGPGSFLFDGYDHQYTDTEFIGHRFTLGPIARQLLVPLQILHVSPPRSFMMDTARP